MSGPKRAIEGRETNEENGAPDDVIIKLQAEKPENWSPPKTILFILFNNLLGSIKYP